MKSSSHKRGAFRLQTVIYLHEIELNYEGAGVGGGGYEEKSWPQFDF